MFISATESGGAVEATGQSITQVVASLRAVGEPTRLRILALLSRGELSVSELAVALGQSQPRVSRHLRLMAEVGLIERAMEGAWVFCRLPAVGAPERALAEDVIQMVDGSDPVFALDFARLQQVKAARDAAALAYFERNAKDWGRVRALHVPDSDIEAAMLAAAGVGPFKLMVDAGVGAGRMIALFAPHVERALGFDVSLEMLSVARAALDDSAPGKVELRLGDVYAPPVMEGSADLVTVHQVLHFLTDPGRAVAQAAKLLAPGGTLLIADFLPHNAEFLRADHAHRRLGFSVGEVSGWCAAAGAPVIATHSLRQNDSVRDGLTVQLWVARRADDALDGARKR
ncbi:MAG: ArsR/SmtB family transcription factor [Caulobacterales bacterium]